MPSKTPLGRPKATGGRVKFTTTLPADVVKALREIGDGNASRAIILLVRGAKGIQHGVAEKQT
jgi:hypothetical protein